jgi:hypothetical protein
MSSPGMLKTTCIICGCSLNELTAVKNVCPKCRKMVQELMVSPRPIYYPNRVRPLTANKTLYMTIALTAGLLAAFGAWYMLKPNKAKPNIPQLVVIQPANVK